jgi:hypothetical protein
MTFPVPLGTEAYVATLDVSGLSGTEYEAVRAVLLRAPTLAPAVRYDLARQVATHVAGRMHHTPPNWVHPELFLACVAAAFQQRSGPPPWLAGAPQPAPPVGVAPAPPVQPVTAPAPAPGERWGVAPARPPEAAPAPPPAPGDGFAPPA